MIFGLPPGVELSIRMVALAALVAAAACLLIALKYVSKP